jgi:hypothetical protein
MMIFGFLRQNLKTKAVAVAFSIAWLAAGVEPQLGDAQARDRLAGFRQQLYWCFTARADALFEVADAVLCADGPVRTLAGLSLAAGSLAYATGNDWDRATGRTVGSGQALVAQWIDTGSGDTYWTQDSMAATTGAGQTVTLNDTAPTGDHWNLAAVEVLSGGRGTPTPTPTTPTQRRRLPHRPRRLRHRPSRPRRPPGLPGVPAGHPLSTPSGLGAANSTCTTSPPLARCTARMRALAK